MTHLDECSSNNCSILAVLEGTSNFIFGSRGDYVTEDFAQCMDGSIETWRCFGKGRQVMDIIAQEEMATNSTFGIRFDEIGAITMNPQYHVGGCICNGSIGKCKEIIQASL